MPLPEHRKTLLLHEFVGVLHVFTQMMHICTCFIGTLRLFLHKDTSNLFISSIRFGSMVGLRMWKSQDSVSTDFALEYAGSLSPRQFIYKRSSVGLRRTFYEVVLLCWAFWHWVISVTWPQRWETDSTAQSIDTFTRAWHLVLIMNHQFILFLIVDSWGRAQSFWKRTHLLVQAWSVPLQ